MTLGDRLASENEMMLQASEPYCQRSMSSVTLHQMYCQAREGALKSRGGESAGARSVVKDLLPKRNKARTTGRVASCLCVENEINFVSLIDTYIMNTKTNKFTGVKVLSRLPMLLQ